MTGFNAVTPKKSCPFVNDKVVIFVTTQKNTRKTAASRLNTQHYTTSELIFNLESEVDGGKEKNAVTFVRVLSPFNPAPRQEAVPWP